MHRFFDHNVRVTSMQDWMVALLISFAVGSCVGCLICTKMPAPGLYEICSGILQGRSGVSSQILCCLLPLTLAGVLAYFSRCTGYLLIPSVLCGFLFSFSVCAFVSALHTAGWVFSALLLAGRALVPCFPVLVFAAAHTNGAGWPVPGFGTCLLLQCIVYPCFELAVIACGGGVEPVIYINIKRNAVLCWI